MMKFNNLRRPPKRKCCSDEIDSNPQPAVKKKCLNKQLYFAPLETDEASSNASINDQLQDEWAKSKPKKNSPAVPHCYIKQRQDWICDTCPVVSEILQKYPILKKGRWVCN